MSELALPEGWVSTKLGNYVYLKTDMPLRVLNTYYKTIKTYP